MKNKHFRILGFRFLTAGIHARMGMLNTSLPVRICLRGAQNTCFMACCSSEDGTEKFMGTGQFEVKDGVFIYDPPRMVTTLFIAIWTCPNFEPDLNRCHVTFSPPTYPIFDFLASHMLATFSQGGDF